MSMYMLRRRLTAGLAAAALAAAGVGCSEGSEPEPGASPEVPSGNQADEAQGTSEGQPLYEGGPGEGVRDAEQAEEE